MLLVLRCCKTTAEDSLSQVAPSVLSLRLEPETDYEIVVKLLSPAAFEIPRPFSAKAEVM